MKNVWMILTLCVAMLGAAHANNFRNIPIPVFIDGDYSVVASGDVDGNGYPDVFCGARADNASRLYLNSGSGWENAADVYDLPAIHNVLKARFVDYNQDGLLDLYCQTANENGIELYRQIDGRRFQAVPLDIDGQLNGDIHSAVWCDANLDGQLELLLSNRSNEDVTAVLIEQIEQDMVEVRGADGPFSDTGSMQISVVDFDTDGDMDYFMSKENGSQSLWLADQGNYRNLSAELGLPAKAGLGGLTWADFNRDGLLDMFAFGNEENSCLFYQDAAGAMSCSFTDVTDAYDLRTLTAGVTSAHAADMNADGRADLFLTCSDRNVVLFNQVNGWQPAVRSHALIQSNVTATASAWADFDRDGDVDVVFATARGGLKLFTNDAAHSREYIGLNLCGTDVMTPVLNCLVEIEFEYGKQWAATSMFDGTIGGDDQTKLIYNPAWYHSEQWAVNVMWPNGLVSHLTHLDIPLNGTLDLHMPSAPSHETGNEVISLVTVPEVTNYPNPFNPSTRIEFSLGEAADVTLTVFNLLGQEVAILARGNFDAGQHSLAFDAAALPSGLYLARLDTPAGSVVHRMLLTK